MSSIFAKPATGTSVFGGSTTTLFGGSAAPAPGTSSIFGQQPTQQQAQQQQDVNGLKASVLAQSSSGANPLAGSLWQPGSHITPQQKPIPEQMKTILDKWDPSSPSCVFKHYFYNKVDDARVPFYQASFNEDPKEWEEALKNKPAPGFVPVLARGFSSLAERLMIQRRAVAEFNARLHEINHCLNQLLSNHDLETSVRTLAARRKHVVLRERCLALAARVQVLRNRGYALGPDEDELKIKLTTLDRGLGDPALGARAEELWSRLIALRQLGDRLKEEVSKSGMSEDQGLSEEVEAKAKKILEDYEKQLQHLKKEVGSIKKDFEQWEKDQGHSSSR